MKFKQGLSWAAEGDAWQYLPSIACCEYSRCPSTLLHVPQKPQGRDLVGFRSDIHIHKESCETLGSTAAKTREL